MTYRNKKNEKRRRNLRLSALTLGESERNSQLLGSFQLSITLPPWLPSPKTDEGLPNLD
jgi:hypothetical protein